MYRFLKYSIINPKKLHREVEFEDKMADGFIDHPLVRDRIESSLNCKITIS